MKLSAANLIELVQVYMYVFYKQVYSLHLCLFCSNVQCCVTILYAHIIVMFQYTFNIYTV